MGYCKDILKWSTSVVLRKMKSIINCWSMWVTRRTYSSWWAVSSSSRWMFLRAPRHSYSWQSWTLGTVWRRRWPSEPASAGHRDWPCPCTYTASAYQSGPPHTATSGTRTSERVEVQQTAPWWAHMQELLTARGHRDKSYSIFSTGHTLSSHVSKTHFEGKK